MVTFTFIDEGLHSTKGFEAFLLSYRKLLALLQNARFTYVACSADHFGVARRLFQSVILGSRGNLPDDRQATWLLSFFRDRDAYERRQLEGFSQAKLIQFREDKAVFSGLKNDEMFRAWQSAGDEVVHRQFRQEVAPEPTGLCEFRTAILPYKYELFGNLTDGFWNG